MNKIIYILLISIFFSCNPKDCFESTGTIIQREVEVENFNTIEVGNEVTLIIKQGAQQKVIIETGENLIDEVKVEVIDNKLYMKDDNSCNFTREYATTKVIVTSPNIIEIRSNTARDIISEGVLEFQNLKLISENAVEDFLTIGDFYLTVNNQIVSVTANGNSRFRIDGQTNKLIVGFFAGSSRFEGAELIANEISITHKSSNDMLVNPQNKISGTIFSVGDVVSYNQPSDIDVEELFTGKLIFN